MLTNKIWIWQINNNFPAISLRNFSLRTIACHFVLSVHAPIFHLWSCVLAQAYFEKKRFLLQVRDLFVSNSEAGSFLLYCCPWLLPPLILNGKTSDLQWVSMVRSGKLCCALAMLLDSIHLLLIWKILSFYLVLFTIRLFGPCIALGCFWTCSSHSQETLHPCVCSVHGIALLWEA